MDLDVETIESLGEDVPLLEGIRTARAIRRLKPDPVPKALIRKVCEAGTFAPSGGNRQPWTFVAVTEPERRAWVAERYRKAFHAYIAPALEAARAPDFPEAGRRNMRAALHLADHLHEAPVHLFVAGWKRRGEEQHQAIFPCVQNVLLACRAVGLGASLTTIHRSFGAEVDAWLGLPPERPTSVLIPIGWPLGRHGRPPRRSVDTCLQFERFDPELEERALSAAGTPRPGRPRTRSSASRREP
ncbi:MAG: nitroreductase family protein [Myxococcota bacterium]